MLLQKHPNLRKNFDKNLKNSEEIFDMIDDGGEKKAGRTIGTSFSGFHELNRKSLSQAVYMCEVLDELEDRKERTTVQFGPFKDAQGVTVTFKQSIENIIERVDNQRKTEDYEHEACHPGCSDRGCEKVTIFDGIWKLRYPICMFPVREAGLSEDFDKFIPAVCPSSPANGKAFCAEHTKLMDENGYTTNLRPFLASLSTEDFKVDPYNYTKEQLAHVKKRLNEIAKELDSDPSVRPPNVMTATQAQGISYFLRERPADVANFELEGDNQTDNCNK